MSLISRSVGCLGPSITLLVSYRTSWMRYGGL